MTTAETYRQLLGQCTALEDFEALWEMLSDDRTMTSKDRVALIDDYTKYRDHALTTK